MKTVYDFSVKDRKGNEVSLKEYANEVLLIVNTATKCGFTPQYEELENLYKNITQRDLKFWISPAINLDSKHRVPMRPFTSFARLTSAQSFPALKR